MGLLGWSCYGIIHIVIAWLAVEVALGNPQEQAAPQGAIGKIGQQPTGFVLLAVLAVGLIAFALSQFTMAAIGFDWVSHRPTRAARKLGALGRAVLSSGIGALAVRQSFGGQAGSSSAQQQGLTSELLVLPAGRVIVGLIAVVVFVVAIATVRRGVLRSFEEDLDMGPLSNGARKWIEWSGIVGWIAKGVSYASVGILFAAAAVFSDPRRAGGLDQALHLLAAYPLGKVVLGLIALGFVAFSVFCFTAARTHRR